MKADQWPQAFTLAYTSALGQHWPEAVAGFRRAKALRPSDPVTSYDLALAQQKMGDYAGAAQEFAAAGALAPSAAGLLGLAISLDRQGKAAEARAAYNDALRLMPEGPDAERVGARVRRLDGVSPQR
jgi:protein O-GlcNAc transferase